MSRDLHLNLWGVLAILVALASGFGMGIIVGNDDVVPFEGKDPGADVRGRADGVTDTVRYRRGVAVAQGVWGQVCGGNVLVGGARLPRGVAGQSTYYHPPGRPLDPSRYGRCVIRINSARRFNARDRCAIVVHEWGHLAGQGHVRNPRAIMNATLSEKNIPRGCR